MGPGGSPGLSQPEQVQGEISENMFSFPSLANFDV